MSEGLVSDSAGKESACNAGDTGDTGAIPGSGRSPGEGNGSPLQHPCLENPMDRGAWQATAHGVSESDKTERLSTHAHRQRVYKLKALRGNLARDTDLDDLKI